MTMLPVSQQVARTRHPLAFTLSLLQHPTCANGDSRGLISDRRARVGADLNHPHFFIPSLYVCVRTSTPPSSRTSPRPSLPLGIRTPIAPALYIRTSIHPSIHPSVRPSVCVYMRALIHPLDMHPHVESSLCLPYARAHVP